MTELTSNDTVVRRNAWGWVYLIVIYPFVAGLLGLIKYTLLFAYVALLGPAYFGQYLMDKYNMGMFAVIISSAIYWFEYEVLRYLWSERYSLSWLNPFNTEQTYPIWDYIVGAPVVLLFYWVIACLLMCISMTLDWTMRGLGLGKYIGR